MPYANHLRLTVSGVFATGVGNPAYEGWSYRLNMSDPPAAGGNFSRDALNGHIADVQSFHQNAASRIGQHAKVTMVKLARIGFDGKYREAPIFDDTLAITGVSASNNHPPQVALAVSLETGRRGPTGRGRIFLPAPQIEVFTGTGLADPAVIDGVRTAFATFVNGLNNVAGLDANASKVTVASVKGYNTDVTSIRVGRALDTIRSRRTSLEEKYSVSEPVS
jgi:hypothetical protein